MRCAVRETLLAFTAALIAVEFVQAQPAVRRLEMPGIELQRAFDRIIGIRELSDGRLLVADELERAIYVVDFRRQVWLQLGADQRLKVTIDWPTRIFALPGDSSAVLDEANRRLLLVSPAPLIVGSVPLPAALARGVKAIDARGLLYGLGAPAGIGSRIVRVAQPESAAIVRCDRKVAPCDTLRYVNLPPLPLRQLPNGVVVVSAAPSKPFQMREDWAVASDGRIAVVHASPYRVDIVGAGGRVRSGPELSYVAVPVTEREKSEWRRIAEQPSVFVRSAVQQNGAFQKTVTTRSERAVEPAEWPRVLPPFLSEAAVFDHAGVLWVRRTTPAGTETQFDLIDGDGRRVQRLSLSAGTSVAGFGRASIYVVRHAVDGKEFLQRYVLDEAHSGDTIKRP